MSPRKWWAKVRRRRPGIYLVRTNKHRSRGRENGYVGLSNNWEMRRKCHLGTCGRHASCHPKPWTDLNPVWHCKTLPWWMGWSWILGPLETLAIWTTWPRYNDKKNRWNPRRVSLWQQRDQRVRRDASRIEVGRLPVTVTPIALRLVGAGCILLGIVMTTLEYVR
jgi:hypothetical protein